MRRSRRKSRIGLIVVMAAAFVIIAALVVLLFLELREDKKEPIHKYASVTEEAAARAYVWLNQIEDMHLSYGDVRKMMGDIRLELILTPGKEDGKYMQALAEGTLTDCQSRAQNGLEKAYREVVRHRLADAGYEGEISDTVLDDLMREAYGVSVSEYLASCHVQLLPTPEELTEMYVGEVENE